MDSFISTIIGWALIIVTIAAIYKMVMAYLYDKKIQTEVKNLLIILIVLGALPFAAKSAPTVGENLVKPVVNILVSVSETVSKDVKVD